MLWFGNTSPTGFTSTIFGGDTEIINFKSSATF